MLHPSLHLMASSGSRKPSVNAAVAAIVVLSLGGSGCAAARVEVSVEDLASVPKSTTGEMVESAPLSPGSAPDEAPPVAAGEPGEPPVTTSLPQVRTLFFGPGTADPASAAGADADAGPFRFTKLNAATGLPVRFNPCRPLHYVVNPAGGPADAVEQAQAVAQMVGEATGMSLVFDGTTSEPSTPFAPGQRRDVYQPERYGPRWAPILIAWAPTWELGRTVGGVARTADVGVSGNVVQVSGEIVISTNVAARLRPVLLHEFGHLMGLAHVDDQGQVMHRDAGVGRGAPEVWGSGDREGLRRLGRASGCLAEPPPADLTGRGETVMPE